MHLCQSVVVAEELKGIQADHLQNKEQEQEQDSTVKMGLLGSPYYQ